MLHENNYTYTESALSYIDPIGTIYWDTHYKNGKTTYSSPLYIFLNNRYLKWAYYTLIIGVLLWVLFEGRRKQRAIPVVEPLPNQTLTFTKTIAGMYLDKQDHKSIAAHQINHFYEYIRNRYSLATHSINPEFMNKLALKSENTLDNTRTLINYIVAINTKSSISQEELMQLNKKIEDFKNPS